MASLVVHLSFEASRAEAAIKELSSLCEHNPELAARVQKALRCPEYFFDYENILAEADKVTCQVIPSRLLLELINEGRVAASAGG